MKLKFLRLQPKQPHITRLRLPKECGKKWRQGLKETIKLMLIRPPQLQFFKDGIEITAMDTKYVMEN